MTDEIRIEWEMIESSKQNLQCFEPLYRKYYPQILKFIYKRVADIEDAYEIATDTFAKAMTKIKKYEHRGFPFSSWLYRIAINEIAQFYRDKSKMRCISIDETTVRNLAAETEKDLQELKSILKKALEYIDEKDLLLLELRFFEERPFAEVAEILGITENNAKVKTYRAVDKLRLIFNKLS